MDIDISKINKVYFVGIGGIGVSAVARMMLYEGKVVCGSDMSQSMITDELEKAGARIDIGQSIDFIDSDIDLIIYTIAISEFDKPLFDAIKNFGVPAISYPEALEIISKDKFTIAVSGTHGKTTTTAMIAHAMIELGMDPTVIVGSMMIGAQSNFIAGNSKYFVVEACEYRRSFLHLNPKILVITNIDEDHLDYYKDLTDIEKAFGEMAEKIPEDGYLVCNKENYKLTNPIAKCRGAVVDYTKDILHIPIEFPGDHNQENAHAAVSVLHLLGIGKDAARDAVKSFRGTWRRFEYKGKLRRDGGADLFDDYAHHPTEIRALVSGAREFYPDKIITVVFQPHLFSRTKSLLHSFTTAFEGVNRVILAPIYPAREAFDPSISSDMLATEIRKSSNIETHSFKNFEEIAHFLVRNTKEGEIVITVGAGDISEFPAFMKEYQP